MRHHVGVVAALAFTACQPLHGGSSEPLNQLGVKPRPAVPVEPIAYVEDCAFDFHHKLPAAPSRTAVQAAVQLDQTADTKLARADQLAPAPEKFDAVNDAIETYSRALVVNPYDPDATLGLARAYDSVRRKGCALALLKRLGTLADHTKFAGVAAPVADSVGMHKTWFQGYRREALSALGRP